MIIEPQPRPGLGESCTPSVADVARGTLGNHPHFRGRIEHLEFVKRGDVLTVRGRVPTFYLKQLVQDALKHMEGVRRIDNQVEVISCEGLSSVGRRPAGRKER